MVVYNKPFYKNDMGAKLIPFMQEDIAVFKNKIVSTSKNLTYLD